MNKTLKIHKNNKYNFSIKQNANNSQDEDKVKQLGGNFLKNMTLSSNDKRINNLFKNFIVKLVKKSIPANCNKSKIIYSEGTKVWNQNYKFSNYSSFVNSSNIYKCKNIRCGIADKDNKDTIKYKSIGLNSLINNLFIQTVIKHEINRGQKENYYNLNTWQCVTTDEKYTKFIIVPDSEHIIQRFNEHDQFARFVSAKQFLDFMLSSKKLNSSPEDLLNKYILSNNLTKFLTKVFNSIDLLFKKFQFQHYNLTLKSILVPVSKAFSTDSANINSNIYNSLNNPVIYNFNKSAITVNIQDIPFIKAQNVSGRQHNKCNANYVRIRPNKRMSSKFTSSNYMTSLFKSRFLPHSSNLPDKMVLVKSIADMICLHAGNDFLTNTANLDKFLEKVDSALSNSSSDLQCGVVSKHSISKAGSYWPVNTYAKIKDKMSMLENSVYFFEKFDIDHEKISILDNNLYVIENIVQPNSEISVYGKKGTTDLTNLNLSKLRSNIALLHDDNASSYQKYSDNPANEHNLDHQFSIPDSIHHDNSFQSSNSSTGLIDIPIPHDKQPGDFITIKDHRGEDATIKIPPGTEPGKVYSAIYTHNDTSVTENKNKFTKISNKEEATQQPNAGNTQEGRLFKENSTINFDLI